MNKFEIVLPSPKFPYRASDLLGFEYGSFYLKNVFQAITEEQRAACVDLWLRNKVLHSEKAALDRSKEVCYFITDLETGELIGVNTLYRDRLQADGPEYFFNRMFIDPAHRNSRVMVLGTSMMMCFAKLHLENQGAIGVVNVNENTKLSRPGLRRAFESHGYRNIGVMGGQEVWLFDFENTIIRDAD